MPELDEPLVNDAEPGWPHSHVIHIGISGMPRSLATKAHIAYFQALFAALVEL